MTDQEIQTEANKIFNDEVRFSNEHVAGAARSAFIKGAKMVRKRLLEQIKNEG